MSRPIIVYRNEQELPEDDRPYCVQYYKVLDDGFAYYAHLVSMPQQDVRTAIGELPSNMALTATGYKTGVSAFASETTRACIDALLEEARLAEEAYGDIGVDVHQALRTVDCQLTPGRASLRGIDAYREGRGRDPAMDVAFMRDVVATLGTSPDGRAERGDLLRAFVQGWDLWDLWGEWRTFIGTHT
jgi:hypothetical protein